MEYSKETYKRVRVAFLAAFVVLTLVLVTAWIAVPKIKSYVVYIGHDPIHVEGDQGFVAEDGVVGGSGSESDPYVIEGWSVSCGDTSGILLENTGAYVVIRNVTISSGSYYLPRYPAISLRNASNVIVDSVTIFGASYGVLAEEIGTSPSSNVTVGNCIIRLCTTSIYFGNLTKGSIENNLFRGSSQPCIIAENSTAVVVKGNDLARRDYDAYYTYYRGNLPDLLVQDSTDVGVFDNQFVSPYQALRAAEIAGCQDVVVSGNHFSYTGEASVTISESQGVSFTNNSCYGVDFVLCDECNVYDNSCWTHYWVRADSSLHMKIVRNMVRGAGGIVLQSTSDSVIEDNVVTNCTITGIEAVGSNNTIRGNLVAHCQEGLNLRGDNITAVHNDIFNPTEGSIGAGSLGIYAHSVNWLAVSDNSISVAPKEKGVYLMDCMNVSIMNSSIGGDLGLNNIDNFRLENNSIGTNATIEFSLGFSGTIDIRHNSMNNVSVINYYTTPAISWYSSYPGGGNYWSQYPGVDEKSGVNQNQPGADGIGDTPYVISSYDTDRYPLMSPVVPDDASPPRTVLTLNGYKEDSDWYVSKVNFTLEPYDNVSGIASTLYRTDLGPWTNYTSQVFVSTEGKHLLEYYSVDKAGNVEDIRVAAIKIDTESPQPVQGMATEYRFKNTKVATIHFEFEDNSSGVSAYEFGSGIDFSPTWLPPTITQTQLGLSKGAHTYWVGAVDEAGNWAVTNISVVVSLNENRDPLSTDGPYGPWYVVGTFADLILLGVVLWLTSAIVYGPTPPRSSSKLPGEIDKEEVVNGYPKYMRKL